MDVLRAIALLCQLNGVTGTYTLPKQIQDLQRRCVAEIWKCYQGNPGPLTAKCIAGDSSLEDRKEK